MTASVAVGQDQAAASPRSARLRPGQSGETLFILPGVESDTSELTAMVAAMTGPQEVVAVAPDFSESQASMQDAAQGVVAAIRQVQPSGPYRLAGYSFGALMALETAQQLRAAGETVDALFLIEAVYDERYWPRGLWLRALVRRTGWQLARIVRMRPTKAAGELFRRAVRLVQRFSRRSNPADNVVMGGETLSAQRAYAAIGGYRPSYYDGSITLIASSIDRHFGCDTVRLWAGYADHLSIQRVDGDHLAVMREPVSAAAVAGAIDHGLAVRRKDWAGVRPSPGFERPMILTTMRWFAVARLAHALIEAGFSVSACRPRGHVLELVDGLSGDYRLNRLWRLRSLVAAVKRAQPDIILPDDERALVLLRRLHPLAQKSDPHLAELVARSLGSVDSWPSITSRTALANVAQSLEVTAPATEVVGSAQALTKWAGQAIVLKTDGSWGGRGVAVLGADADLGEAWRTMSNPPGLPRALKRMVFNFEVGALAAWLRRVRPVVNAQGYIEGREAIATVACLRGEVQAIVCLEVVEASEPKGPAAVVRIIDHAGMAEAARRLVGRFGLSGFCGFDFILDDRGTAHLLELNPRVTPTCHLLVEGDHQRSRTLGLFPAEAVAAGGPNPLDLPARAPSLLRRGQEMAARHHRPVAQMARKLKRKVVASRYQ